MDDISGTERRRRELLEQTRYRYRESEIPAVHPRYGSVYTDLYGTEDTGKNTLGIRTVVCMILFAVFVFMQNESKDILHVNSAKIIQEVTKNPDITDIVEVWKGLP